LPPPGGAARGKKQEQVSDVEALIKDLSELKVGDPVVHAPTASAATGPGQHGLGARPQEFLHLEYADKATLYVPVSQLHQISRYTGVSADEAPLHRLGSGQWEKAKRKRGRAGARCGGRAAQHLRPARRPQGHAFRYSPRDYEQFANDFGFEETADQRAAIHAVIQDMISPQPHGPPGLRRRGLWQNRGRAACRLYCHHRRQASGHARAHHACLAEQHYQTLVDRFAKWPVKVAEMSRFRSAKEITAAVKGLADGTIDIVVGTHKLLEPRRASSSAWVC
jgi:transcription-repair coupling factor (superfamily II helicase)